MWKLKEEQQHSKEELWSKKIKTKEQESKLIRNVGNGWGRWHLAACRWRDISPKLCHLLGLLGLHRQSSPSIPKRSPQLAWNGKDFQSLWVPHHHPAHLMHVLPADLEDKHLKFPWRCRVGLCEVQAMTHWNIWECRMVLELLRGLGFSPNETKYLKCSNLLLKHIYGSTKHQMRERFEKHIFVSPITLLLPQNMLFPKSFSRPWSSGPSGCPDPLLWTPQALDSGVWFQPGFSSRLLWIQSSPTWTASQRESRASNSGIPTQHLISDLCKTQLFLNG